MFCKHREMKQTPDIVHRENLHPVGIHSGVSR